MLFNTGAKLYGFINHLQSGYPPSSSKRGCTLKLSMISSGFFLNFILLSCQLFEIVRNVLIIKNCACFLESQLQHQQNNKLAPTRIDILGIDRVMFFATIIIIFSFVFWCFYEYLTAINCP